MDWRHAASAVVLLCFAVAALGSSRRRREEPSSGPASTTTATATEKPAAKATADPEDDGIADDVDIKDILAEYKDNEVRADGTYKGKRIRVTGKVGDVKKDVLGGMYVTVGTGKAFEIPKLQCTLKKDNLAKAAQLSKGDTVTVKGKVSRLLFNVQVSDCDIE
jgi:hypothetical protein